MWCTAFEYYLSYIVFWHIYFFRDFPPSNIIAIILTSLHRTGGPSCCLLFDIYNSSVVLRTDKPQLFTVVIWLHCILCQQYGRTLRLCDIHTQRWVQFIDIHSTAIFLSRQIHIQDITRWLFNTVLHFVKSLVWYQSVFNKYSYYVRR